MKRSTLVVLIVVAALLFVVLPFVVLLSIWFTSIPGDMMPAVGAGIGCLTIEGTITESRNTIQDLKWLERNPSVKALLVEINSPGGTVTPAHEIYSEIVRIRDGGMPVVVSMGTIAASGGYYIAAPANRIVANPGTLTGSIGVIMELPVFDEMLDKLGVAVEVIKSREHKDIGSPFRRMTPADRELLEGVVLDVYEQFVEVVSHERGLSPEAAYQLADGRIMTGRQALQAGLVDTLGTFEDARRICGQLVGIEEPRIIRPRRRLSLRWTDILLGTADKVLGFPRSPRLSYVWP